MFQETLEQHLYEHICSVGGQEVIIYQERMCTQKVNNAESWPEEGV